jgi:hypothetical protein
MGDAYGLRVTVIKSADFDPSVVTSGVFKITKPDGRTLVEWASEISDQSADSITAYHAFASDGSELDVPGYWTLWIQWTVPGRTLGPRTEPQQFEVLPANK